MSTFNLLNLIKIVNPHANVDFYYGPYDSILEAKIAVDEAIRAKGKTVGILQGTKVVEYWWRDGITDTDLIEKSSEIDLSEYVTQEQLQNLIKDYYTRTQIDDLLLGVAALVGLEEDITATIVAGNISIGDVLEEGLSFTDFVRKLVETTYNPTFIAPSLALTNDQAGTKEIGQSLTVELEANFNRGQIKGVLFDGLWRFNGIQGFRAGEASQYRINGSIEATNSVSLAHTVLQGVNTFTAQVDHLIGPQPTDSEGNNFSSPLAAGTLIRNNTQMVGQYKIFLGNVVNFPTNSSQVRALPLDFFQSNSTNTIDAFLSSTKFVIAVPPGQTLQSAITGNNENITNNFVSENLTVQDAGGSNVSYTLYKLTNALAPNVDVVIVLS